MTNYPQRQARSFLVTTTAVTYPFEGFEVLLDQLSFMDNGDTFIIGGKTYTIESPLTTGDGKVFRGASQGATATNLIAAINLTGNVGTTLYSDEMTAHPDGLSAELSGSLDIRLMSLVETTIGGTFNPSKTQFTDLAGSVVTEMKSPTVSGRYTFFPDMSAAKDLQGCCATGFTHDSPASATVSGVQFSNHAGIPGMFIKTQVGTTATMLGATKPLSAYTGEGLAAALLNTASSGYVHWEGFRRN